MEEIKKPVGMITSFNTVGVIGVAIYVYRLNQKVEELSKENTALQEKCNALAARLDNYQKEEKEKRNIFQKSLEDVQDIKDKQRASETTELQIQEELSRITRALEQQGHLEVKRNGFRKPRREEPPALAYRSEPYHNDRSESYRVEPHANYPDESIFDELNKIRVRKN